MSISKIDFSQITPQKTLEILGVKSIKNGLRDNDVVLRVKKYGKNEVSVKHRLQWLKTLVEPFANWFVFILLLSAIISFLLGKRLETVVILLILLINALIYYVQNYTAGRALNSLQKQGEQLCSVKRNGRLQKVRAADLVPGDIVLLREGVKIAADGRILASNNLHTDESIITGESEQQHKISAALEKILPIYNQTNMVFKGTFVTEGDGEIVVTAIGINTEFGRIAKLSQKQQTKSPLQEKIDKLTSKLILFVFILAGATFLLKLFRGATSLEALRFILSLIVSAIPEGLPITVVIVLVFGVKSMAKKHALVRNLSAVETIGQVTLIATDKTGTITKNKLHIAQTWSPSKKTNLASVIFKSAPHEQGKSDEIDKLIDKEYRGQTVAGSRLYKRLPFVQNLRMSGAVWLGGGVYTTYLKGSAESIMDICRLSSDAKEIINKQITLMASEGMRVLAVAAKNEQLDNLKNAKLHDYSFAGLIAFGDELRPRVKESVKVAHGAGIDIILLTGDHKEAAGYFAALAGIVHNQSAKLGSVIANSTPVQIRSLIKDQKVFGRVLPEHKFKILSALHKNQITAMTGDGINDVPALSMANVGVAVGSGNDAAKEASDMIILDNNFATIVEAISQGRAVVRNVKKMLTYVLATNLGEIFTIVGALVIGLPVPITALQILWINFVTDSFTMIPLGFEKAERNLMNEPPADPLAPIVGKKRTIRIVCMALIMAVVTLAVYIYYLPAGVATAQAIAFSSLVVAQWANSINSRSDNHSFVEGFKRTNWLLIGGISIALILQVVVANTALSSVLNTQPLSANQVLIVFGVFCTILIAGDILKKLVPIKHINQRVDVTK